MWRSFVSPQKTGFLFCMYLSSLGIAVFSGFSLFDSFGSERKIGKIS
ncbi:hypothetical protein APA_1855 [Pseudanabaena sp. lw0831]|nr:hypothetical protein APA_1855 [Pseudanabaena sp. lw0831]